MTIMTVNKYEREKACAVQFLTYLADKVDDTNGLKDTFRELATAASRIPANHEGTTRLRDLVVGYAEEFDYTVKRDVLTPVLDHVETSGMADIPEVAEVVEKARTAVEASDGLKHMIDFVLDVLQRSEEYLKAQEEYSSHDADEAGSAGGEGDADSSSSRPTAPADRQSAAAHVNVEAHGTSDQRTSVNQATMNNVLASIRLIHERIDTAFSRSSHTAQKSDGRNPDGANGQIVTYTSPWIAQFYCPPLQCCSNHSEGAHDSHRGSKAKHSSGRTQVIDKDSNIRMVDKNDQVTAPTQTPSIEGHHQQSQRLRSQGNTQNPQPQSTGQNGTAINGSQSQPVSPPQISKAVVDILYRTHVEATGRDRLALVTSQTLRAAQNAFRALPNWHGSWPQVFEPSDRHIGWTGGFTFGFTRELPNLSGDWQFFRRGEATGSDELAARRLADDEEFFPDNSSPSANEVQAMRRYQRDSRLVQWDMTHTIDIVWVPCRIEPRAFGLESSTRHSPLAFQPGHQTSQNPNTNVASATEPSSNGMAAPDSTKPQQQRTSGNTGNSNYSNSIPNAPGEQNRGSPSIEGNENAEKKTLTQDSSTTGAQTQSMPQPPRPPPPPPTSGSTPADPKTPHVPPSSPESPAPPQTAPPVSSTSTDDRSQPTKPKPNKNLEQGWAWVWYGPPDNDWFKAQLSNQPFYESTHRLEQEAKDAAKRGDSRKLRSGSVAPSSLAEGTPAPTGRSKRGSKSAPRSSQRNGRVGSNILSGLKEESDEEYEEDESGKEGKKRKPRAGPKGDKPPKTRRQNPRKDDDDAGSAGMVAAPAHIPSTSLSTFDDLKMLTPSLLSKNDSSTPVDTLKRQPRSKSSAKINTPAATDKKRAKSLQTKTLREETMEARRNSAAGTPTQRRTASDISSSLSDTSTASRKRIAPAMVGDAPPTKKRRATAPRSNDADDGWSDEDEEETASGEDVQEGNEDQELLSDMSSGKKKGRK